MFKIVFLLLSLSFAVSVTAQSEKSYLLVEDSSAADAFMKEIALFLESNEYFDIATYDGAAARVRPVKFVCVLDNKIAMVTSSKKEMYEQMKRYPQIELTRTANDRSAYMRYLGTVSECKNQKVIDALLAQHPWPKDKFKDTLVVLLIEPKMAGIFSMKGKPAKTKTFGVLD